MRCARPGQSARRSATRCTCGISGANKEQLARHQFGLVILDPAYKVLGDRDENANGEIANLMNELEKLAQSSGAAVIVAHHFAKGDSSAKEAGDRLSGADAWVRDPDSIVVLTPHEEPACFTVASILRNLPQLPEFVVGWEFPLMRLAPELNPEALRRPSRKTRSAPIGSSSRPCSATRQRASPPSSRMPKRL